ncbi:TRIC cation channel family protein [Geodermatophilus aquaeductus]|uniref:TRIC cation channel family protein n=1 Tax=Geodermatophilus aquaeductus TaxID=1564161 RepID=UPI00115A1FDB|nr:TRIC cation channel family protein [Geodermatophilus aquaeductus]
MGPTVTETTGVPRPSPGRSPSLNGAPSALRATRLDIVGVATLGMITALGGGTPRDVLIRRVPSVAEQWALRHPGAAGRGRTRPAAAGAAGRRVGDRAGVAAGGAAPPTAVRSSGRAAPSSRPRSPPRARASGSRSSTSCGTATTSPSSRGWPTRCPPTRCSSVRRSAGCTGRLAPRVPDGAARAVAGHRGAVVAGVPGARVRAADRRCDPAAVRSGRDPGVPAASRRSDRPR